MKLPRHAIAPTQLRQLILQDIQNKSLLKAAQVRDKMDAEELLGQMLDLVDEADLADLERLEQLKFKADVLKTVLKKCLPDLRSVEISEKSTKVSKLVIDLSEVQQPTGNVYEHGES